MKKVLSLALGILLVAVMAWAGTYEKITVSTTPIGFNAATIATYKGDNASAYCCVNNAIMYKTGGTVSATEGLPVAAGGCFKVKSKIDMQGFNAIKLGSSDATMHCEYYSQ
jgi:hypothetical protein